MKLELSRIERFYLIESLDVRIKMVENLLKDFKSQTLIAMYSEELNELIELKNKITLLTNVEYFQNIQKSLS